MKLLKITSLLMMLGIAFSISAQEEFFDDVYFSSGKAKQNKPAEKKNISAPQNASTTVAYAAPVATSASNNNNNRDVDEYNRQYTVSIGPLFLFNTPRSRPFASNTHHHIIGGLPVHSVKCLAATKIYQW